MLIRSNGAGRLPPQVAKKAPYAVADALKQDIFSGRIAPGETLPPPDELIARFGVSRPTLREALSLLESDGLLRRKPGPGGGAIVQQPDSSAITRSLADLLRFDHTTLAQLLDVRVILEPAGARLAALRATAAELAALAESVTRQHRRETLKDAHLWMEENLAFHGGVAAAAHNPPLRIFSETLRTLILHSGLEAKMSYADRSRSVEQHVAILSALEARDPDLAERLLRDHLENSVYVRKRLVTPVEWSSVQRKLR